MSGRGHPGPPLALGAAFCFALALILTQYGLRTVPSWRSPIYTIGSSMIAAWLGALLPPHRDATDLRSLVTTHLEEAPLKSLMTIV